MRDKRGRNNEACSHRRETSENEIAVAPMSAKENITTLLLVSVILKHTSQIQVTFAFVFRSFFVFVPHFALFVSINWEWEISVFTGPNGDHGSAPYHWSTFVRLTVFFSIFNVVNDKSNEEAVMQQRLHLPVKAWLNYRYHLTVRESITVTWEWAIFYKWNPFF